MRPIKFLLRAFGASPVVTSAAILSLGLGIGAQTAVFSVVNSLVLRSLPVPDPEQLVIVSSAGASTQSQPTLYSYATFDAIRRQALFDGALAWSPSRPLTVAGEGQPVQGVWVSGDFFSTLRVRPLLGRALRPEDDAADGGTAGTATVVSYRYWQREFNASPAGHGGH